MDGGACSGRAGSLDKYVCAFCQCVGTGLGTEHLAASGCYCISWGHLGASGNIWEQLGTSGVSGNIWATGRRPELSRSGEMGSQQSKRLGFRFVHACAQRLVNVSSVPTRALSSFPAPSGRMVYPFRLCCARLFLPPPLTFIQFSLALFVQVCMSVLGARARLPRWTPTTFSGGKKPWLSKLAKTKIPWWVPEDALAEIKPKEFSNDLPNHF